MSSPVILVTGAAGFLGRRVLREAARAGCDVVGLVRGCEVADAPEGTRVIVHEWRSESQLAELLERTKVSAVVHCAGHSGRFVGPVDPEILHDANVLLTGRLLAAVCRASLPVRVILVSSAAVYGPNAPLPTPEDAPLDPTTEYGASKVAAERLGAAYRAEGIDVRIARPFNVIGAGESLGSIVGTLASQVLAVPAGQTARVRLRETSSARDFVDADDTARALLLLATTTSQVGTYNVCTGTAVSVNDLVARAALVWGRRIHVEVTDPEARGTVSFGDPSALFACGWHPERSLEQTLAAVAAHHPEGRL
jgi:nucleoside-diphosphate-sugar epimerase